MTASAHSRRQKSGNYTQTRCSNPTWSVHQRLCSNQFEAWFGSKFVPQNFVATKFLPKKFCDYMIFRCSFFFAIKLYYCTFLCINSHTKKSSKIHGGNSSWVVHGAWKNIGQVSGPRTPTSLLDSFASMEFHLKSVIFDLDGVLVDTEKEAWHEAGMGFAATQQGNTLIIRGSEDIILCRYIYTYVNTYIYYLPQ